jgi:Tol biopolymer transport system component
MALTPGTRLGPYEVISLVGRGGMGEVYRARDTILRRDVAIKILPEAFALDADRIARFEREARTLAALDHPNIAAVYGFDERDAVRFLVEELVAGESLAERVARGPLGVRESLTIALQLASALEAAHGRGIVHRDLKPANIVVTAQDRIKLLDFGLAKTLLDPDPQASLGATMSVVATSPGTFLGTAGYMSPEQARGKDADTRSDVWSFGCVVYELLTGRRAFEGETTSDVIVSILEREPDWPALPRDTPATVVQVLRKCLRKDPLRRMQHIGDARIEIEDAIERPSATSAVVGATPRPPRGRLWPGLAWAILGFGCGAATIAWMAGRRPALAPAVARFSIAATEADRLEVGRSLTISPDGRRIAFVASTRGEPQLYIRDVDQLEAKPVVGTTDANDPFFSSDGEWLAFFAGGKLKKSPIAGGPPVTICDAPAPRGGSWSPDGTIVFAPTASSRLMRVSSAGGVPAPLTTFDAAERETSHRWPHVLPDGRVVIFAAGPSVSASTWNDAHVVVQSLVTGERRVLATRGSYPRYVAGYLVYLAGNALLARPMDAARLDVSGTAVPVLSGVARGGNGSGKFEVAAAGTLVYVPGAAPPPQPLVWVDRNGAATPLPVPPALYVMPRLSPDGARVAVTVAEPETDIWVFDVTRGTSIRVTSDNGNLWSIWTPDGSRLVYSSTRDGPTTLRWKRADGSGPEETLLASGRIDGARSWLPDGTALAFDELDPEMGVDMLLLRSGKDKPQPLRRTRFTELETAFSPNGRWFAYTTSESGRNEVFVEPYPARGERWQVSTNGGAEPMWSFGGRELFYRHEDEMWSVPVTDGLVPSFGTARKLFSGPFVQSPVFANYDVSRDGERFVMVKVGDTQPPAQRMEVVVNWTTELRRRLSTQ